VVITGSRHAASCSWQWRCCSFAALSRETLPNEGPSTVMSQLPALSCDVHACRQTGGAPVNGVQARCWQGCLCLPLRCVCGKMFRQPEHVRWLVEREHGIPADWTSRDYSYHHHYSAAPHCTQFVMYPFMPAAFCYMRPSADVCGATLQACSLFPADRFPPLPLCCSGST